MKPYRGPPATLSSTATAQARLIVWCRDCRHKVEPDPAEHAARYGADLPVIDWVKRLKCSRCGSRSVDFVLTGRDAEVNSLAEIIKQVARQRPTSPTRRTTR